MSTNRSVITDALREIHVLDADQTASPEDGQLALRELNRMMAVLAEEGIDLGFPPQDSLSDDFPLDSTSEAQITSLLSRRLLKYFPSAQLSPSLIDDANTAMSQLQRAAVLANMEEANMSNLPRGEGQRCRGSIISGD